MWDEVVIKMSAEALCIDLLIVPLVGRARIDFDICMFPEVCTIGVFAALITLEMNLWSGVITGMLTVALIDVAPDICAELLVGVDVNMCARTMTSLKFMPALPPSEEALISGWEACS